MMQVINAFFESFGGGSYQLSSTHSYMDETEPKVKTDINVLSLRVKDQTGSEVVFKVNRSTKFGYVHAVFCAKKARDPTRLRFIFDGQRISSHQTPEDFDMKDGDVSYRHDGH